MSAFDGALLEAGIGNVNLIRVTSILPPHAEEDPDLTIPFGSLVPTAYGTLTSEISGQLISAAVGVGFSRESFGIIMETAGVRTKEESEVLIKKMLEDSFQHRGMEMEKVIIKGIEHRTIRVGAVIAAVAMWY